jgi:F-type H+-transporting ATPase subunit b
VGDSVADDARRAGTVDRFLDELQAMAAPQGAQESGAESGHTSSRNSSAGSNTGDGIVTVRNGRRRR